MNEILSKELEVNFQKFVKRIIEDFEVKNDNLNNFEPKGFELIFMVIDFSCNYSLEFEKDNFYLKINYEIDDKKNPELRKKFYQCLDFLILDERFYSQDSNSIILKSKVSRKNLERAKIIFFVEKSMNSYFFSETKIALEEIVNKVFAEFKDTMQKIWKTLYENFEIVDFSIIPAFNLGNSKDCQNDDNAYDLPVTIKMFYDYYRCRELEQEAKNLTIPKRKINWLKRIYMFGNKIKI